MTEGLRRNRAVVVDSYQAYCEGTSSRPSTVTNNRTDALEPLSAFHEASPAQLKHLLISTRSLNAGEGRELDGHAAKVTMTLDLATNKGHRQRDYKFKHAITPNARQMVRSAPVRILRQRERSGEPRFT